MKARFYAALLCVAIPASMALAGDTATCGPFITAGQPALLFQFSGLSTLGATNYLPYGIGGKLFLTPAMAIRGALQFATMSQSIPAPSGGEDGSASVTQFGIQGALEYHFTQKRISPYVGGEIAFSTNSNSYTTAASAGEPQYTESDYDTTLLGSKPGIQLGFGAIAGVEVFIAKQVSLSAEYTLEFSLFSQSNYVTPDATYKFGTLTSFGFRQSSGILTLNIYL